MPAVHSAHQTVQVDFEGKIVRALEGAGTKFNKQDRCSYIRTFGLQNKALPRNYYARIVFRPLVRASGQSTGTKQEMPGDPRA
jgi:hypothetical protein